MKRKLLIQGGIAVVVLLVLALSVGVGQAYATTGCFTDTVGHWAETFICWMSDNGITTGTGPGVFSPEDYVTRGQMSVFMQRQAEIPPTTGNVYINAGLNDWMINGGGTQYIRYYTNVIELHAPGAGIYGFQITPDLPATFYGRQMYTHSVKLCYDATHGATLTGVYFRHYAGGAIPAIPPYREIVDLTDRIDATCREYIFPTDGSLWGSDHVVLYIQGDFAGAANSIWIGATTFTLKPSSFSGVLSPEEADARQIEAAPQSDNSGNNGQ